MSRISPFQGRNHAFALLTCVGVVAITNAPVRAETPPLLAVLCKPESVLAIVEPATGKILGRVPTGADPHEVILTADSRLAIVANYGGLQQPGSTLSIIDLAQRKEIRRVDLGALRRPHGMAEIAGKVYFTAEVNSVIARYDLQADRVDWLLGTGEQATHMLVATPDGENIYTANIGSNTVSAIHTYTPRGTEMRRITVGQGPEGIALSPDGRELWVGHRGGNISLVDTKLDSVKGQIETQDVYLRLLFTPDGKRVLAPDLRTGDLVIYDAGSRKPVARVPIGSAAVGITLDGDGKQAFISAIGDNKVVTVDLEKLAVVRSFSVGEGPDGIAWAGPRKASPVVRARGALGVAVAPLPEELRKAQKLDVGIVVQMVFPGSSAEAAGLRIGDVILGLNGEGVDETTAFVESVFSAYAGDVLTLDLLRGDKKLTLKATLTPRPRS